MKFNHEQTQKFDFDRESAQLSEIELTSTLGRLQLENVQLKGHLRAANTHRQYLLAEIEELKKKLGTRNEKESKDVN